jgi:hypothetical protein
MAAATVELIGPHGYTHGWVYHGPGRGTATHTRRLAARDVRTQRGRIKNASPALVADRATAALRGRKGSDYQHLAAARLHMAAARAATTPEMRTHHTQLAAMHRGIAQRTPGRGTRGEGPVREAGSSGGRKMVSHPTGKASESTAGRKSLAKLGLALPDGSYPVGDAAHWEKARRAIGRTPDPAKRARVAALLRRTAARYGKTAALKASWAASNLTPGLELAMPPKIAITSPYDVMIVRGDDGTAVVRNRHGGGEIARIRREPGGSWVAAIDGRDLNPHTRQRGALLEAIGRHNRAAGSPYHRPDESEPVQPPPRQSPLMAALGMEPVRLATPVVGASDGPRATSQADTDDKSGNGLSAKGQAIYKKLKARGFPDARALAFARRAQNFGGGGK